MKGHTLKALLPVVAFLLIGLVANADTKPAPQSNLSQEVGHRLALLPWYGVFDNLQYQVNGTEVLLSGAVTSQHDQTKYDAAKTVERIQGVTKVVNDIRVLPISTFDEQIRRAEYRAIFSQSDLGRYTLGAIPQIHIIVDNGHVILTGTVINQMDRAVAGIAANGVSGVFSVTNNLRVAS
jgi:hyperosmotically inducible protein